MPLSAKSVGFQSRITLLTAGSGRNIWKSLPNSAVVVKDINTLKSGLDTYWQNQEKIYEVRAQL